MTTIKRKALAFILIIVIALSVASWLVYNQINKLQNQISELQAQNGELQDQISRLQGQIRALQEQLNESHTSSPVRIVAVNYIGGFNPVVGLLIASQVNVTVLNNYTSALSGLTLTPKFLESNGNESGPPYTYQIDELQAGETREIKTWVYWSLGTSHTTLVVTLRLVGLVMDEQIVGLGT